MTIAEKLREAVDSRGIKRKWLAEKVGISETALSMMLGGKQSIDVEIFFRICTVLNMTPDEIYAFKKGA